MATVWDISETEDRTAVDTQPNKVRAPKSSAFSVIVVAVGAIVCAIQAPVISHDPGCTSMNIISVQKVFRVVPDVQPASPGRRAREQYSPDATAGMSTGRLAEVATHLFSPVEEAGVDVDYSFG
jgi:hypothetical protein